MKTRLIVLVAAFCAAFGVWAATETVGGYAWTYRINGNTAEIYGTFYNYTNTPAITPKPTGAVTIPSTLGGKPVTSIGHKAFYNCYGLTNVMIPSGVTRIGDYAFYGCNGLTSVTIPDRVTSIGRYAFDDCTSLTSVIIGNSVTCIQNQTFSDCFGLTNVVIGSGVTHIDGQVFDFCRGLTNVTLPDSITQIGYEAFRGCRGLTSITIPDSVTSIGSRTFYGCTGLTNVVIGSGVTSFADSVFESCSGLKSVTIPDSVASIGSRTFYDCSGLTNVVLGSGIMSIGDYAFENCSGLTSVTIPDSVTNIGNHAFAYCRAIERFVFNGAPPSVGSWWPFDYVKNDAIGIYPAGYATAWEAVINDYGYWTGLKMSKYDPPLTLAAEAADWKYKGAITLRCEDADTSGAAHTYTLEYRNANGEWETAASSVAAGADGCAHLTDESYLSRLDGIKPVVYRVSDENGRVSDSCVTRKRHGLFIALDEYENGWQRALLNTPQYAPTHQAAVFRNAYIRYGGANGYIRTLDSTPYARATLEAIRIQLDYIRESVAEPGDIVLFYYIGHGGNGVLTCYGEGELLSAAELSRWLADFPQGTGVAVIIDACHSESVIDKTGMDDSGNIGWIVAARAEQSSFNDWFTVALCENGWFKGLADSASAAYGNGDGYVTFGELATYGQQFFGENWNRLFGDRPFEEGQLVGFYNSLALDHIVAGKVPNRDKSDGMWAWLTKRVSFFSASGGDVSTAAKMTAANGTKTVGECYELGIDPEDPDDDFRITDFKMEDGKPVITVNHTSDGSGESFLPRLKTLGKAKLSDEWQEVPEEGNPDHRFFKVTVEME